MSPNNQILFQYVMVPYPRRQLHRATKYSSVQKHTLSPFFSDNPKYKFITLIFASLKNKS